MIIHTRSPLWEPVDAIPRQCCASIRPSNALEGRQVRCTQEVSWKTPPVLQVSAVCLRNTAKHMTGKSTLTLF
ncbi:hypothetical protein AK972_0843 [Pseudomonas yamanorum]|nr:hypothetical protein AK972_0843 [Pseudomonas yamanorum]